jgi:hypothetical protein
MNPNPFCLLSKSGLLLGAVVLSSLTSCVDYASGPGMGAVGVYSGNSYSPPYTSGYGYGYAGLNSASNYHYYPRYGTYYSPQSRQYYYQRGSSWQTRSSPYGVSSRTFFASPYVPLNLHSSPSYHHSMVSQSYPHNWSPPGQNHGSHSSGSSRHSSGHSSSSHHGR